MIPFLILSMIDIIVGGCRSGGGGCPLLPQHDTWCCQPCGVRDGGCGLSLQLGCCVGCLQRGGQRGIHIQPCERGQAVLSSARVLSVCTSTLCYGRVQRPAIPK